MTDREKLEAEETIRSLRAHHEEHHQSERVMQHEVDSLRAEVERLRRLAEQQADAAEVMRRERREARRRAIRFGRAVRDLGAELEDVHAVLDSLGALTTWGMGDRPFPPEMPRRRSAADRLRILVKVPEMAAIWSRQVIEALALVHWRNGAYENDHDEVVKLARDAIDGRMSAAQLRVSGGLERVREAARLLGLPVADVAEDAAPGVKVADRAHIAGAPDAAVEEEKDVAPRSQDDGARALQGAPQATPEVCGGCGASPLLTERGCCEDCGWSRFDDDEV